jgi:hypothetical protein
MIGDETVGHVFAVDRLRLSPIGPAGKPSGELEVLGGIAD